MSNYTKTTNFAAKDSLPSGNAGKIVKGTEIDAEFNNIATASATKADINDVTLTGTTTFGSLNDGTITITGWVDEDNMSSNSAVLVPTQQSVKAYVDSTTTAQDLDVTDGSASIDIDLDSESLGILGGTGVTSTASGTGVTLAIDSTVATLTGSQTLTNKTLTTPTILTSFTIGSATISEAELEILDGATVTTAELNVLDGITSTTAELNILDGVTSTAAEINILDGVTSTTAELNKLDGFTGVVADLNYAKDLNATGVTASEFDILDGLTSTTAELNILDGVTSTTAELNILDGVTSTTAELNILDGVTSTAAELNILDGVTSTTAELNILDGVTSTATELNLLDGVTATTAELNYTDGVTSAIQTQLDSKISGADAALTGNVTITTSDNTTQLALISTDADANAGPILDLFRNSVSAVDNDLTGQVYFSGKNDADEKTFYGQITSQITDVSNGSEDFALELSTLTAGSSNSRLFISPTETVFNESSADVDFRVESDNSTHALFVQGSDGNVGIKVSAPTARLSLPAQASGDSGVARFAIESAVDSNDFTIAQYEDGTGTYTQIGQNISLNSGGNVVVLDSGHKTAGITFDGRGNGSLMFQTGAANANTEHMRIDSAGNVGIGATSLSTKLEVADSNSGAATIRIRRTDVSNSDVDLTAGGGSDGKAFDISVNQANRMRIDSSGNVLVGTTSHFNYSGSTTEITVGTSATGSSAGGAVTFVSNNGGTTLGYIGFQESEASVGTMGTRPLKFTTNNTERMRIDSSGNVLVGTTDTNVFNNSSGSGINLRASGEVQIAVDGGEALYLNRMGTDGRVVNFRKAGAFVAGIDVTSSAVTYNTSSDQRLKENIEDADDAGSKVDAIQVRKFDWKVDGSHQDYGMIAQELQTVAPEAVSTPEDPDEMMGVDYSKLVPMLVKEIQSLRARVNALETE